MGSQDEHSIVNLQFMKITGLYQIMIPSDGLRLFNTNIYKIAFILQILYLAFTILVGFYSIYIFINDVNQIFNYSIMIFSTFFAIFKYCFIIKNAKTIWSFLQHMISTNFLCYKHHTKEIFKIGRTRSSYIILISFGLWSSIALYWCLFPILNNNNYLQIKFEDGVYNYRMNAIGYVYPVTDTFYNKYFYVFYTIETFILIFWCQMMWVFDILIISVCISIKYQLKTIAKSYSTLGLNHYDRERKSIKSVEAILDLEIMIQDHQKIYEKMKKMYQILKPTILIQLGVGSFQIFLQPCMILKLYFDGSLSPVIFFKLLIPEIPYVCHLFLTCYLFSNVNEQKEFMNFALYSSDWTDMSVKFKKLLLCTMRMNDAENLKMKISLQRIVDMEMFANVIHITYKVLSVMMKIFST